MKQFNLEINGFIDTIRYAAYAVTDIAWVFLELSKEGSIRVTLTPKKGNIPYDIKERFLQELCDEELRTKSRKENVIASEMIIKNAINTIKVVQIPEEQKVPSQSLTPSQEKELDELIAEVERELQAEMNQFKDADPKHITKTWEESNKDAK